MTKRGISLKKHLDHARKKSLESRIKNAGGQKEYRKQMRDQIVAWHESQKKLSTP